MAFIDLLREDEFRSLDAQVQVGLSNHALKTLDERGSAQELVRDQYSGRYPFELLQNANDAALGTAVRGRAHFRLTDTALIVADNGAGFGDRQIRAICSLGRSSKGPGSAIGHKGLGFKSVGEITDLPQILSRGVGFQFDAARLRQELSLRVGALDADQRFPVYAFPFPATFGDLGPDAQVAESLHAEGYTTVIRLPFRPGVERSTVARHLVDSLLPRLLLFLNGVDHLALAGTEADFSAEVSRGDENGAEHVLLQVNESLEEWLIYRASAIPDLADLTAMGDAWVDLEEVNMAIAVPLDARGEPLLTGTYPLHVFFPTEDNPGLRVAVHAEWALSMDRRHVSDTPTARPFNTTLLRKVADFAASTVAHDLRERFGASLESVAALCPLPDVTFSPGAAEFHTAWTERLASSDFLPTLGGGTTRATDVQLLPASIPDPALGQRLADLVTEQTLRADVEQAPEVRRLVREHSSLPEFTPTEFLARLRPPSRVTLPDFYLLLMQWRAVTNQSFTTLLRSARCVLLTNGALVSPGTEAVFLPRARGDNSLPDDLPVPIALVPEIDGVDQLLLDLGVNKFEWRDLIRDFLIKILEDPLADASARRSAMNGLRSYQSVARTSGSEELTPVLGRVLLPVRSIKGSQVSLGSLRPAAATYFGVEWTGNDDIEVIYGPFGQAEFLDVPVPEGADEREQERDFYRMLGVLDHPRVEVAVPSDRNGLLVGGLRHPHRGRLFDDWMASPSTRSAARCGQGQHPQSQQHRLSQRLDRHEEIVDSGDARRLLAFWRQLALKWGTVYEPAMQAQFRCVNTSHVGERTRSCESLFAYTLRTLSWVPIAVGNETALVPPSEAWIDATDTPRRIKERIPRVSDSMMDVRGGRAMAVSLNLIDAGRPSVESLLHLLEAIVREADLKPNVDREIQLAARYIQRTLDDVLRADSASHPSPETVRLLAVQSGQHRFVAQPPYAEDQLLRETWEQQIPVLAAEPGLTRLAAFLVLDRLDSTVETSAIPYGEHTNDAVARATLVRINQIKPYLLALVRSENPRAENVARRVLNRLEVVICDELILRYAYLDQAIERPDAVCYIATRREGVGGGRRVNVIGTAYLELDRRTEQPHWFPLGRLLAQHVGVPSLGDAFTMLLTAAADDRARMLIDRQISAAEIDEARTALNLPLDVDEVLNVLDTLDSFTFPEVGPDEVEIDPWDESSAEWGSGPGGVADQRTDADVRQETEDAGDDAMSRSMAPPPIDYSAARVTPAELGLVEGDRTPPGRRTVGGGPSSAPSIQSEVEKRRIGRKGEEFAFKSEQKRLKDSGKDPSRVTWVALSDELAPYDLVSVDDDDQRIYIEVKSTAHSDPREAFYMSQNELLEAMYRGSRYYLYRVVDVDSQTPRCFSVRDPLRHLREGRGRLLLDKAHVTLSFTNANGPTSSEATG